MRYHVIDGIRGITIISMIAYHACWDLKYLAGMDFNGGFLAPGGLWQLSICMSFIFISGFCLNLSGSPIRRGCIVFVCGGLITFFTVVFLPQERIVFGVLTFLGSAMIIAGVLKKYLDGVDDIAGLLFSVVLFVLTYPIREGYVGIAGYGIEIPRRIYRGLFFTYLGFMEKDFFSADYFPVIPWIFLFLAGYYTCRRIRNNGHDKMIKKSYLRGLEWTGRHSLVIYLVHQPIIYLFINLLSKTGGS